VLRKSVIIPSSPAVVVSPDSLTGDKENKTAAANHSPSITAVQPSASAGAAVPQPPSTPAKYSKEIDQKESPKLVVLFDTRFTDSEKEGEEEEREKEEEKDGQEESPVSVVPAWHQPEPISPIPACVQPYLATPTTVTAAPLAAISDTAATPVCGGSPRLRIQPDADESSSKSSLAAVVSNSTFNESKQQQEDCRQSLQDQSRFSDIFPLNKSDCPALTNVGHRDIPSCGLVEEQLLITVGPKSILGRKNRSEGPSSSVR
jgi:hypothetical protein